MHQTRRNDPRRAKVRDMGRSILPAKGRKGAREDLTAIRQKARSRTHRVMEEIAKAPCTCSDMDLDSGEDYCPRCDHDAHPEYPKSEHRWAIRDRREKDKVAPIMRWADAIIPEGMYPDEAYATMRAMLPAGIVGDHAMTHLDRSALPERNPYEYLSIYSSKHVVEDENGEIYVEWPPYSFRRAGAINKAAYRERLTSLAEWVISSCLLGEFNKLTSVGHKPIAGLPELGERSEPALMGEHDIENWVAHYHLKDEVIEWAKERGWADPRASA